MIKTHQAHSLDTTYSSGDRPLIVGIGGTLRPSSSTERLLCVALAEAERAGGRTLMLDGAALDLPLYPIESKERVEPVGRLVEALRAADGVIIASPGYHGTISGHIKNALDYIEDLREDERPYLDGRAVGCCAAAAGWQASVTTLVALRSIVHALRGWPTPLGLTVNTMQPLFSEDGNIADSQIQSSLVIMARQVVDFAIIQRRLRAAQRPPSVADTATGLHRH